MNGMGSMLIPYPIHYTHYSVSSSQMCISINICSVFDWAICLFASDTSSVNDKNAQSYLSIQFVPKGWRGLQCTVYSVHCIYYANICEHIHRRMVWPMTNEFVSCSILSWYGSNQLNFMCSNKVHFSAFGIWHFVFRMPDGWLIWPQFAFLFAYYFISLLILKIIFVCKVIHLPENLDSTVHHHHFWFRKVFSRTLFKYGTLFICVEAFESVK